MTLTNIIVLGLALSGFGLVMSGQLWGVGLCLLSMGILLFSVGVAFGKAEAQENDTSSES